jgi:hypothetical protein
VNDRNTGSGLRIRGLDVAFQLGRKRRNDACSQPGLNTRGGCRHPDTVVADEQAPGGPHSSDNQRRSCRRRRQGSHPEIDGIGSVAIGLLLAGTSAFLARESKSLLMGERAYPSVRKSILAIANKHPGCLKANGLITVQLGPEQVVAMLSLKFADSMLAPQIEEAVISLEKKVREANPEIVAVFVKPQTAKTFEDQRDGTFDSPKKTR